MSVAKTIVEDYLRTLRSFHPAILPKEGGTSGWTRGRHEVYNRRRFSSWSTLVTAGSFLVAAERSRQFILATRGSTAVGSGYRHARATTGADQTPHHSKADLPAEAGPTGSVCPAPIDAIWLLERTQHIHIGKSPPSPRLRRAAFALRVFVFARPHHSKAGEGNRIVTGPSTL